MQEELFDQQAVAERVAAETLIVDVDGFEGPLDLLLTTVAHAKGGSAQNFCSGSGGSISQFHRKGARDCASNWPQIIW